MCSKARSLEEMTRAMREYIPLPALLLKHFAEYSETAMHPAITT
jgi:hypothetical protein